ncbi:HEAT repeat domain-containing protein [Candidatus Chloroploca sp. Khr17]|uniref:HEAT repeat domain-containing protein n=1 Tax=Candidatus Chloroploca sp. Khr17 TaxID=2496869 RepID=UPI001F0E611F|nr:HEAT repeat domain-containing protein [Candidatus Chloroploca sp. Khr17]
MMKMMSSSSTLELQLIHLGDQDRPLAYAELKSLAELDAGGFKLFQATWPTFPAERRIAILRALNELGEDNLDLDFRPIMRECLHDSEADVRAAAIVGLWEDEHETTMDQFIMLMTHDGAGVVRATAAVALARFAYQAEVGELEPTAGQRLLSALLNVTIDPEQPLEVRRRAIEGLGYFAASKEAQAEIGRAYAHTELAMRESAVLAMGRSMRPTWLPYIERELQSPSPAMRYEAARAVGECAEDGRPLLPALLPLIEDEDTEIALMAIWALGQVGGPGARRVLERLVRSRDATRREAATDALEELSLDEL